MDIHEKSTNLNMGLQNGILRKIGVCVRVGRSAPPTPVHTELIHLNIKNLIICLDKTYVCVKVILKYNQ